MRIQSALSKWKRRSISIPVLLLLFVLVFSVGPFFLLTSVVADLFRKRNWATTRFLLYVILYLSCEVIGVFAATWGWIRYRSNSGLVNFTAGLQVWWAGVLYRGMIRIFSMKVDLEGDEHVRTGPIIVFPRHVSTADTIIPSGLILVPHRIYLRHVMKAELLWDPCIDIACNRLKNLFIWREKDRRDESLEGIKDLASDLGDREGIVFYPEGTRFTSEKQGRVREKLDGEGSPHLVESMKHLHNVLPPKLGGTLTLLRAAENADVVFCAHSGFELVTKFSNLLNGGLVGITLRVRFWRVSRPEIPVEKEAQEIWLVEQWEKMDRIVGELKSADSAD